MTDMQTERRLLVSVRELHPPGRKRRRALRQAGLRVGIQDFTVEERDQYWHIRGSGVLPDQKV